MSNYFELRDKLSNFTHKYDIHEALDTMNIIVPHNNGEVRLVFGDNKEDTAKNCLTYLRSTNGKSKM